MELSLNWQCKGWGALPDTGGMYDQDYALMRRMTAAGNVHRIVEKWDNLRGKQIHTLSDSERRLLRSLKDMGVL